MSAGLRFTVITDDGEWTVVTDLRDVMAWERHARKHGLPARNVDNDNSFPQAEYMAVLAWSACTRAGDTALSWPAFAETVQGIRVSDADIAAAAESAGLPGPTRPQAGTD